MFIGGINELLLDKIEPVKYLKYQKLRGKLRGIGYTRKAASKRKKKPTSKFFKNPFMENMYV